MPHVAAVDVAFPPHYYPQAELAALLATLERPGEAHFDGEKVARFFSSVGVEGRHLALPLEAYRNLSGLGQRNTVWMECALGLGEKLVSSVLEKAGLSSRDIQLFASSTVTGIAVPSIEARLMNRLSFSPGCRRMPLFGLGCLAGAAGLSRVSDYLVGHPEHAALLLCVELGSLTWQRSDTSTTNIIACGLFGDGAGCALVVGDDHPLARAAAPRIADTQSLLFADSERTMGWDIVDDGFRIVLGSGVPELARTKIVPAIRAFLSEHDLLARDITAWIAHPGGPAVIESVERGLELSPGALDASRHCLARVGNVSSVSVLFILRDLLRDGRFLPGDSGLLFAMGPGFCAELVLLR